MKTRIRNLLRIVATFIGVATVTVAAEQEVFGTRKAKKGKK